MRVKSLDILKVVCCYCIVMLHTMSTARGISDLSGNQLNRSLSIHQLLYMATPTFMMITGAVFLGNTDKTISYHKMVKPVLRILCSLLVFGAAFSVIRMVFNFQTFSVRQILLEIWTGTTWSHMWYMYVILGIYLIMPVVSAFYGRVNTGEKIALCVLLFSFTILLPTIGGYLGAMPAFTMPVNGTWLLYLCVGGLLYECREKMRNRPLLLSGSVVCGIFILYLGYRGNIVTESHYACTVFTVFLFSLFCTIKGTSGSILTTAAGASLYIYMVHPVFIHLALKIFKFNPLTTYPMVMVPLMAFVVYLLSLIFTCGVKWMLNKIDTGTLQK